MNGLVQWVGLACFLFVGMSAWTQPHKVDLNQALLPIDPVVDIVRDRAGFIWLATQRGLVRFDSRETRWYQHQVAALDSLSSSNLRVLFVDRQDVLWVGTSNGLNRMDRIKGTFTRFLGGEGENTLLGSNIWCVYEDAQGALWVGTDKGLNRLVDGRVKRFSPNQGNFSARQPVALVEGRDEVLYVGTFDNGMFVYDRREERFRKPINHPAQLPQKITALVVDHNQQLWLGTMDQGVWLWDPNNNRLGGFEEIFIPAGETVPARIGSLHIDQRQQLWVQTDHQVFRAPTASGGKAWQPIFDWQAIQREPVKISGLYADVHGLVWVSTEDGEMHLYNTTADQVDLDRTIPGQSWAIEPDADGGRWYALLNQGLLQVDGQRQRARYLREHSVRALYRPPVSPNERAPLWVGTYEGVLIFDDRLSKPQVVDRALTNHRVWAFASSNGDDVWLAGTHGLQRRTQWRDGLSGEKQDLVPGPDTFYTALATAPNGDMWIGSYAGLFRFRANTDQFEQYAGLEHGFQADDINHITTAGDGRVWVATHNGGLHVFDPDTEQAIAYTAADGYPDNTVVSVAVDGNGVVWSATGTGLARLDPATGVIHRFGKAHGFDVGAFLPGSLLFNRQRGQIILGGASGVATLSPGDFRISDGPQLVVAGVRTGGQLRAHYWPRDTPLQLTTQDRAITVTAVVADFLAADKTEVAFLREGIDDTWTESINAADVNYTRFLPYGGERRLFLRGQDSRGRNVSAEIGIVVARPWWVWWSPLFGLILIAVVAAISRSLVLRRERLRQKRLEEQARLAEARAQLANQQKELEIEARRMQEENTQILQQHLEQVSTQVANDLHDGPMGTLQGMTFRLMHLHEQVVDEPAKVELAAMTQQVLPALGQSLRNLCGELLLPDFQHGLDAAFDQYADGIEALYPQLTIARRYDDDGRCLSPQRCAMLFRIFRTTLKNVVQHANASRAEIHLQRHGEQLRLTISDDGCGFDAPSAVGDLKQAGHFGLFMSHYFAERAGGRLSIRSTLGEGTHIRIDMPVTHHQEEIAP